MTDVGMTTPQRHGRSSFAVEVCDSLEHLSDTVLDCVTADSTVFLDRRWLRMLDAVDLPPLVGGEMSLRYVVVSRDGRPAGLCPFLVTRSRSIYWYYSFEKYFFSWQEKALRLDPARAEWIRTVSRLVAAYRRLVRAAGARTDGWVLAASPFSFRGDIATARLPAEDAQAVREATITALQDAARDEKLPLCFFGVQEDKTELRETLRQRGFAELFLISDHLLRVPGQTFTDYLSQFRSDARRLVTREIQQAREAGVRFEVTQEFGPLSDRLAQLYEATYSRYGEDHLHYFVPFWTAVERYVAPRAEAIVAYRGREPIGFSLLLNKAEELWFAAVGRVYEAAERQAPVYFNLAFYEPMKRALALGARRLWLGPGAAEAKRRRGARACALSSFLWFPRRWSRALLMPYLDRYSRVSRRLQDAGTRPSSYLKADTGTREGGDHADGD